MRRPLIFLALFTILSLHSFAQSFVDIAPLHQNYYAATYLSNHGIINGYTDGTFKPYNKITRAELLKVVMEGSEQKIQTPNTNCFPDVPYTEWYAKYICSAKSLGIIEGYSDNSFKPNRNISKAEAMKIISISYDWDTISSLSTSPFNDASSTDWFGKYVLFAKNKNLLPETRTNQEAPYYYPQEEITRGGVAEVIFRYLAMKELNKEKYTEDLINELEFPEPIIATPEPQKTDTESQTTTTDLSSGIITVKLSWQSKELDLDTHFLQPDGEEIYFLHKIDTYLNAILENNEQSETLTINTLGNGTYEYFINLFSGEEDFNNAKVEVYDSKGLAKIYEAPSAQGKIWKVFELQPEYKLIDTNLIGGCELLKHSSVACPDN